MPLVSFDCATCCRWCTSHQWSHNASFDHLLGVLALCEFSKKTLCVAGARGPLRSGLCLALLRVLTTCRASGRCATSLNARCRQLPCQTQASQNVAGRHGAGVQCDVKHNNRPMATVQRHCFRNEIRFFLFFFLCNNGFFCATPTPSLLYDHQHTRFRFCFTRSPLFFFKNAEKKNQFFFVSRNPNYNNQKKPKKKTHQINI